MIENEIENGNLLKFEDRAWEHTKHPRLVSEELEYDGEMLAFEVRWHHGRRGWYLETVADENHLKSIKIFSSVQEIIAHFEKTYNITLNIPLNRVRLNGR